MEKSLILLPQKAFGISDYTAITSNHQAPDKNFSCLTAPQELQFAPQLQGAGWAKPLH
jgi:hypothetical protein